MESEFFDFWLTSIQKDLAPFCDPNTELMVDLDGKVIRAEWSALGIRRQVAITVDISTGVTVTTERGTLDYRSFLGGPDMGNLLGLAKSTLQAMQPGIYVPSYAMDLRKARSPSTALATDLLADLTLDTLPRDSTRVVVVTGDAGAGKTSVLKELVRQQADKYLQGKARALFLYVNAQGRALARFSEALATELNDLRILLPYHAVSTLARHGLVIPVIDGFDELLGVGGYDDAFSSLSGFIEELDGRGSLIASARSTYYEQEFVARANRVSSLGSHVWEQTPVQIKTWSANEVSTLIEIRAREAGLSKDERERLDQSVDKAFEGINSTLKTKPLFITKTLDLLLDKKTFLQKQLFSQGKDLLEQLVGLYVERERTEKLLSRSGAPLLSTGQLLALWCELAEEMWNQETRELDKNSVREVATYTVASEGKVDGSAGIVIERMPKMAFLSNGQTPGGVAFEHEVFFSYFLAKVFASRIPSAPDLTRVMGRGILPADLPELLAPQLTSPGNQERSRTVAKRLGVAGMGDSARSEQGRENAGMILAATLRHHCSTEQKAAEIPIRGVAFAGADLSGVILEASEFRDVHFKRANLSTFVARHCTGVGVFFVEPLVVMDRTVLDISGVSWDADLIGLRVIEEDGERPVYDPPEIRRILGRCGAFISHSPPPSRVRNIKSEVVEAVERFLRLYNYRNPVYLGDENTHPVFKAPQWAKIEKILIASGAVSQEIRVTGGPRKTFLRRHASIEDLSAAINPDAKVPEIASRMWAALETAFPARK